MPPELWKSIGDELVYTKLLTDPRETLSTINAWMRTVKGYRSLLREQFPTLDLKSTAWIAGFPVHNAEVIFKSPSGKATIEEDDDDPVYGNFLLLSEYKNNPSATIFTRDFIGPAIDTGFRISHIATNRRFVISIELALMLVSAVRVRTQDFPYPSPAFFYEGRHDLKGVFGGTPYPIFWIDMKIDPTLEIAEDTLNNRKPISTDDMKSFCEEFIKSNSKYSFTPYIVGSSDPAFARVPDHHAERIKILKDYWENENQKRKDEKGAALRDAPDTDQNTVSREPSEEALQRVLEKIRNRVEPAPPIVGDLLPSSRSPP
jgi:hypothetical protein